MEGGGGRILVNLTPGVGGVGRAPQFSEPHLISAPELVSHGSQSDIVLDIFYYHGVSHSSQADIVVDIIFS